MEYDDNILHAAYLKHAYVHAQAHSQCNTQCSAILLGSHSGIVLVAPNLTENITAIQNLFFQGCKRGLSFYGMDVYCPIVPTLYDAIGLYESGVRSITFHQEFSDKAYPEWKHYKSIDFLDTHNVILRCFSGKVTKKNLSVKLHGEQFIP